MGYRTEELILRESWEDVDTVSKCMKAIFMLWSSHNVVVTRGKDATLDKTYGFPYTSSSDFAAIWNTNCVAKYKFDPNYGFVGLALSETDIVIAIFEDDDENYLYIPITKIRKEY